MSTELETPEVHSHDIARPVLSPDEAERMVRDLRQLIARILVPNQHYMKFRGKDVLLKAGAEELGKFFGLSSRYEDLVTEPIEVQDKDDTFVKVWSASVKCSVANQQGRVLAESYGFYSGDERRKKNGFIDPQPTNTIVKMAQKRAYVGAILTATGTSELFTQDVEDAAAATVPAAVPDRMPTDAEKNALCELFMRKGGKDSTEAAAWLVGQGKKADSYLWLANTTLAMVLKPDFDSAKNPENPVVPTEPELPAEPGVLEGEVEDENPDDYIPF